MNERTKQQPATSERDNGSKWKTVVIVIAVIVFFFWASSGESGYGGDCTSLGNGAEWGSDC